MTKFYRSFRIFGSFSFGSLQGGNGYEETDYNCAEILHVADETGRFQTLVRLRRVVEMLDLNTLPPGRLPPSERNVFSKAGRVAVAEHIRDVDEEEALFWATRTDAESVAYEDLMVLQGAIWLDQFVDAESETPSERFPLVADYQVEGPRISRILFGNGTNGPGVTPELRFELGFAMPAPIRLGADEEGDVGGAIGMGAIFPTVHAEKDRFARPTNILLGPSDLPMAARSVDWVFGTYGVSDRPVPNRKVFVTQRSDILPHMDGILAAIGFPGQSQAENKRPVVDILSGRDPQSSGQHIYAATARRGLQFQSRRNVVKLVGTNARINLERQLGGVLETHGRDLIAEYHWITRLSDDVLIDVLNDRNDPMLVDPLHVSLRFSTKVAFTGNEIGPISDSIPRDGDALLLKGAGLEEALRLSNNARSALVATDRQPQTILPRLLRPSGSLRQGFTLPLIAYTQAIEVHCRPGKLAKISPHPDEPNDITDLAITPDTRDPAPIALATANTGDRGVVQDLPDGRDLDRRLLPDADADGWREKSWRLTLTPEDPIELRMLCPGFNDQMANPDHHHSHILIGHDVQVAKSGFSNPKTVLFSMANAITPAHDVERHARLGSLAFSQNGRFFSPLKDAPGRLRLGRRDKIGLDTRPGAALNNTMHVTWDMNLAISQATPVTIDIPHGERAERPDDLLIPESDLSLAKADDLAPAFRLQMTESLDDDQDRHLTAALFERSSRGTDSLVTYTVLMDAPFSAYRFSRLPLDVGGDTDPVAEYDSDARTWQLRKQQDLYRMTRPAGAVGEDADKPGVLELHSPPAPSAEESGTLDDLPPAPEPSGTGVERRHAVNMRLSPPTTLWVRPSDLARDSYLPEYAGRQLFRQRGDFGPGMGFAALRTELIYGLSLSVLVPQRQSIAPPPRVAEIEALTGRMMAARDEDPNEALSTRWRHVRRSLQRRPERLEIWTYDLRRNSPFVPAEFRSGTASALRDTAIYAPPVKSGKYSADQADQPGVKPIRFGQYGLAGGAVWPIESANVLRVLGANPIATGTEVDGLSLSPFGNSGNQTSRFLDGYITIISETHDGFLQRHRVEVLGRIAGLWHRAKHVVIYERTTAASRQFVPQPEQPTRTNRPVLRKVEEFVEILQPSRFYPDIPDVPLRTCGCLEEVRFNSTIIPVNSAWGGDVGDFGWKVPLWNRGEAMLRPQVYPYPDLAFVTTGEGDIKATQECLDVETTYFYTDPIAAKDTVDTDKWPARLAVDTTRLGHAKTLRDLLGIETDEHQKYAPRRPQASRILHGTRPFTWRLAPSPVRSRINAHRGTKPIFSGLASVMLVRDPGGGLNDEDRAPIESVATFDGEKKETLATAARHDVPFPRTRENADAVPISRYDNVVAKLEDIQTVPDDQKLTYLGELEGLLNELAKPELAKDFDKELGRGGQGVMERANSVLTDVKSAFDKAKEFDEQDCATIAKRATDTVTQRKLLLVQMVRRARTEYIARINSVTNLSRDEAKRWIIDEIRPATRDVFDQANQNLGDLHGGVATARAVVGIGATTFMLPWHSHAPAFQFCAVALTPANRGPTIA